MNLRSSIKNYAEKNGYDKAGKRAAMDSKDLQKEKQQKQASKKKGSK